jgi:DNA-binding transcriptional ArsR family regulator
MSGLAPDPDRTIEAKLFRGLADPARLGILLEIRRSPRTAGELATALDISPSNASNHLRCLLECGLVKVESSGRYNLYRLADPSVARLLDASRALLTIVSPEIEACLNYGPPDRRALRPLAASRIAEASPTARG